MFSDHACTILRQIKHYWTKLKTTIQFQILCCISSNDVLYPINENVYEKYPHLYWNLDCVHSLIWLYALEMVISSTLTIRINHFITGKSISYIEIRTADHHYIIATTKVIMNCVLWRQRYIERMLVKICNYLCIKIHND